MNASIKILNNPQFRSKISSMEFLVEELEPGKCSARGEIGEFLTDLIISKWIKDGNKYVF